MIEKEASKIINNIIKAYRFIHEAMGVSIPQETVVKVLKEAEHIAIHELAHGLIHTVYPEIIEIHHRDPVVGECIDEICGRLIELYVSSRVGSYTHSFEEHAYELKYYTTLRALDIKARDLEELYRNIESLLEEKKLKEAIEIVTRKCMEWINIAKDIKS